MFCYNTEAVEVVKIRSPHGMIRVPLNDLIEVVDRYKDNMAHKEQGEQHNDCVDRKESETSQVEDVVSLCAKLFDICLCSEKERNLVNVSLFRIFSSGVVSLESLKILCELTPHLVTILSKHVGVPVEELKIRASRGVILATDIETAVMNSADMINLTWLELL